MCVSVCVCVCVCVCYVCVCECVCASCVCLVRVPRACSHLLVIGDALHSIDCPLKITSILHMRRDGGTSHVNCALLCVCLCV